MSEATAKPLPPVIVIGMHRSGTTMIARMLSDLGVFMGADLERNHESLFFIACNDWLLGNSGGRWDNPGAMKWLQASDEMLQLSEEYLAYRLRHAPARHYTGLARYVAGSRALPGLTCPWGWKDPRNTFTLPFWLRLFPAARIVHIYRNGVAVAGSLCARAKEEFVRGRSKHRHRLERGLYRWRAKRSGFGASPRALDLRGAFSLWEEYLAAAFDVTERGSGSVFAVKYEDFLSAPEAGVARLASFCGLAPPASVLARIAVVADGGKREGFLADPELLTMQNELSDNPWMKRLGYV